MGKSNQHWSADVDLLVALACTAALAAFVVIELYLSQIP